MNGDSRIVPLNLLDDHLHAKKGAVAKCLLTKSNIQELTPHTISVAAHYLAVLLA